MDKIVVDPSSPNIKAAKSNENVNPAESNKQSENDNAADKDGMSLLCTCLSLKHVPA